MHFFMFMFSEASKCIRGGIKGSRGGIIGFDPEKWTLVSTDMLKWVRLHEKMGMGGTDGKKTIVLEKSLFPKNFSYTNEGSLGNAKES